jgi:hypothetical protein
MPGISRGYPISTEPEADITSANYDRSLHPFDEPELIPDKGYGDIVATDQAVMEKNLCSNSSLYRHLSRCH